VQLALGLRLDLVVGEVELEHTDRPSAGGRDHRLQRPDDPARAVDRVGADGDVQPSLDGCSAERPAGDGGAVDGRAVVAVDDAPVEVPQAQADERAR
jgi:hypothetical protein